MNDDTVHRLRAELVARKGEYRQISQDAGLSYSWLCKFARGRKQNPTISSMRKLQAGLRGGDGDGGGDGVDVGESAA